MSAHRSLSRSHRHTGRTGEVLRFLRIETSPVITLRYYAELAIHPVAPSFARSHVERVLADLGRRDLTSSAQLIASELVTNAVKASGLHLPTEQDIERYGLFAGVDDTSCIWIGLYPAGDGVVVEVWDGSRRPPRLTTAGFDDLGGRGLFLVDWFSDSWGYHRPTTGGKVVWARLGNQTQAVAP
ncbi:ATP-binding protein [Nonomuraea sp. NPDC050790]|uniref:ATP-binding protein n=1 Tax=Nonomuraea sp. NPDC050790 TaxID=3364371 RepID=UPI0037A8AD5A